MRYCSELKNKMSNNSKKSKDNEEDLLKYKSFWNITLSDEKKRGYRKVNIEELKNHFKSLKHQLAVDILWEAIDFTKQHKTWKFWECCACVKKFGDYDISGGCIRRFLRKSEKGLDGISELTMSHQRHPWMIQNGYFVMIFSEHRFLLESMTEVLKFFKDVVRTCGLSENVETDDSMDVFFLEMQNSFSYIRTFDVFAHTDCFADLPIHPSNSAKTLGDPTAAAMINSPNSVMHDRGFQGRG
ncbi:hypothetical protein EZV62_016852 [Acer yangbiense]|uniref:DUF629 domain-containing protein n=1 Tax=Acer yangbiense TaxID=1000413 RepID=A0A5C7HPN1_9ROSI|nr:hypothetical protein EZV62_016852 [Acer yangbiense]